MPLPSPNALGVCYHATLWVFLREGMDLIMTKHLQNIHYSKCMNLYTAVYNYCTTSSTSSHRHSAGTGISVVQVGSDNDDVRAGHTNDTVTTTSSLCSDLYNKLVDYFATHVEGLKEQSDSLQDEALLRYYAGEWERYTTGARYINRLFTCLNRLWVEPERKDGSRDTVYPVYTLALVQWKSGLFLHLQGQHGKLAGAVLRLIERQRNGETIDEGLVEDVVNSFVSLGLDLIDINETCLDVYKEHLETPFLEATERYYQQQSEALLAGNNDSDYLRKAQKRLRDEVDLVGRCFRTETRTQCIWKCIHALILQPLTLTQEDFRNSLDFEKDGDMEYMYPLSRIPEELEPLKKKFEGYVIQTWLTAVSKLVGEAAEGADGLDPKAYVDTLSEVHRKHSETVTRIFRSNAGFVACLDKACREFVNYNAATGTSTTKSPELLAKAAKHVVMLPRKNNEMAEEEDLEGALDRITNLLQYIDNEDVFQTIFRNLLDLEKYEDLETKYLLLSRIPEGLEPLKKKFEEHVMEAGLMAVSKLVGEGTAREGADGLPVDPKAYVDALLEVHHKNSETVTRSFRGEAGFVASLDKACREFVNRNAATGTSTTKSPELLAKHADMLLRKSNKMAEDEDLEGALNRVLILFKYIEDKDVFQTFYTIKLSKRLIHSVSASDEAEASMISKLKEACGFEYTNKLQRMFTDMSLSKDLTDQFKERMQQNHDDMDINFGIMVLGTNFWPLNAPNSDFIVPPEILPTYYRFSKYYQTKHSGRKLTWLWNYSKNELRTNYLNQKYFLMTSSYQMAVLLQYNNHDTLSLEELVTATAISKEILVQVLSLLVKAKVLINDETDQYDLNPNFKSKKIRVNLNQPIKAEVKAESSEVLKTVDEDRKYVIQATIVRIMKARKTMKNQPLIQEVISQISQRFAPKIPDIKKAIDTLLEKEYIERVDGTRDTFAYVA